MYRRTEGPEGNWGDGPIMSHVGVCQFYVACIQGLGVQIVPGRVCCNWRLSPLSSIINLRENLPKVGMSALTTTKSEHCIAEIKGDQTTANGWHLTPSPPPKSPVASPVCPTLCV